MASDLRRPGAGSAHCGLLWKTWSRRRRRGPAVAAEGAAQPILVLGLVSGALTALLFGVVLLLVVGWAMRPLSAALAVTLVPIAALAGFSYAATRGRESFQAAR